MKNLLRNMYPHIQFILHDNYKRLSYKIKIIVSRIYILVFLFDKILNSSCIHAKLIINGIYYNISLIKTFNLHYNHMLRTN